jgi:hypothetical protein
MAINSALITSSQTWNWPAGVTRAWLEGTGGGGAGGAATGNPATGGGGGGGAFAGKFLRKGVESGLVIAIGAAGVAVSNSVGGAGGDTTVTQNGVTRLTAKGGSGGNAGTSNSTNGGGGSGGVGGSSVGDYAYDGGAGGTGSFTATTGRSGAGGSAAWTKGNGNGATSGTAGTSPGGDAGDGAAGVADNLTGLTPTSGYGGGGSGGKANAATNRQAGNGFDGAVRVWWDDAEPTATNQGGNLNPTTTIGWGGGNFSGSSSHVAQSFLAPASFNLSAVWVRLANQGDPTDNVYLEIISGNPTTGYTVVATSNQKALTDFVRHQNNGSLIGPGLEWFTFSSPPSLVSGQEYSIVARRTGPNGSPPNWMTGITGGSAYANGTYYFELNGTWTPSSTNDVGFELYGDAASVADLDGMFFGSAV